ncbi:MAG: class I SAM-dependent methyltransferase [Desulfuromonadales bacterium]|nr:class I SAM-dependent methyltransferase [Desulfuromonadales bacterium]
MRKLLAALFKEKQVAGTAVVASSALDEDDYIVFSLDEPPFHLVTPGAVTHFSGWVLNVGRRVVTGVGVDCAGERLLAAPVSAGSALLGNVLPHVRNAASCGFGFDLRLDPHADHYDFKLLFEDGRHSDFFRYDLARVRRESAHLARMRQELERLAMPDGRLIAMTQGHENVLAYRNSIIPFVWNVASYLAAAGGDVGRIRSVLDIGCGSGRALTSWHLDDPTRRLCGCDINDELIAWGRSNLPPGVELYLNPLHPPLPFPAGEFDLVQLISVFTHLSLPAQREWLTEIARHVSASGYVLVTMHGRPHVRACLPDRLAEFDAAGYIDLPHRVEGANSYVAYHARGFAKRLFAEAGFVVAGYFPGGTIAGERVIFPLAAQQDVYLLKKTGSA